MKYERIGQNGFPGRNECPAPGIGRLAVEDDEGTAAPRAVSWIAGNILARARLSQQQNYATGHPMGTGLILATLTQSRRRSGWGPITPIRNPNTG